LILELDVVHEGHSWFADKGSTPLRLSVNTSDGETAGTQSPSVQVWNDSLLGVPQDDSAQEVEFPMYAVPKADVLAFLASRGAETFYVENDDRGGQDWEGFRYFARK
jgi:hypothetical protein